MTSGFVLSLCKTISVCLKLFCLALILFLSSWIHIECASLSAHNRVPVHKPTQRQGGYKCIRVRTAPQRCYKGGNSLREFDDARHHCATNSPAFAGWTVLYLFCMLGHCRVCMGRTTQSACGCGCCSAGAQSDEHVALYNLDEFRPCSKLG